MLPSNAFLLHDVLFFEYIIGEFGHVYRGKLTLQNGKSVLVAAKTLKVRTVMQLIYSDIKIKICHTCFVYPKT